MKFHIALVLFLFSTISQAQISVQAFLDSSRIYIGDQVNLNIGILNVADETNVRTDIAVLDTVKGLEVLNVSPWIRDQNVSSEILTKKILLTSFDSGYFWIPEIEVEIRTSSGADKYYTQSLPLRVDYVPLDSLVLAPIKEIDKEPVNWLDFRPYVIALALILLIALAVYIYIRLSSKKSAKEAEPVYVPPPYAVALEKLERLDQSKLWQQGLIVQYQSELSFIIREYLEKQFEILALESTTGEIMSMIRPMELSPDLTGYLDETLHLADLVKFAKAQPSIELHDKLMEYCTLFVLGTKDWKKPETDLTEEE